MPRRSFIATGIAFCLLAVVCPANAATSTIEVDPTVTIPDIVANNLIVDGEGDDWTGAVLKVDLTGGGVYHTPGTDPDYPGAVPPCPGICGPFPPGPGEGDTYVGIVGDGSAGIAGGASDLDCSSGESLSGTGVCAISITWFNTAVNNTAPVQIGNISLSDDAAGTWEMITSFAGGQLRSSGPVINGVMVPEPASLALLGMSGLMLIRLRGFVSN